MPHGWCHDNSRRTDRCNVPPSSTLRYPRRRNLRRAIARAARLPYRFVTSSPICQRSLLYLVPPIARVLRLLHPPLPLPLAPSPRWKLRRQLQLLPSPRRPAPSSRLHSPSPLPIPSPAELIHRLLGSFPRPLLFAHASLHAHQHTTPHPASRPPPSPHLC